MKNKEKHIIEYLKYLRLAGMRQSYKEITRLAVKERLNYEDYLLTLLEEEATVRGNNRINRYLKASKLPLEKNLDNFDIKRLPLIASQKLNALLDGGFIDRTENLLVFGNPGSGKTHLVAALGNELIYLGKRVLFSKCSLLVQDLLNAKKDLMLAKKLKKLSKFDAIIIDDIGYVQQSREEMEVLFTLLADRYERSSIIITSNLPFSKWEKIFKDPMITAAAIDRLVHHSVIIELNIESYRIQHAKSKTGKTKHNE